MSRVKMVTRSMKVTVSQVLMVNLETQATESVEVSMPSTYKDDNALLKAITKVYTNDTYKPVHVMSSQVIEKLYGMTEKEFLDNAQELDPKTRKLVDTDEVTTEEVPEEG